MKRASSTAGGRRQRPAREPRKVRSPKLAHLIAEQLRADIASGKIGPGDTLPSEAELLDQFGISRPTLREALRVLEAETLIQLGRGSRTGARVLGPSVEAIARRSALYLAVEGATMGELHEVRLLLEPPIAALLALRPKRSFVRVLRDCIERQAAAVAVADYAAVLAGINEYHNLMINLSENKALNLLAGILQEISSRLHPHVLLVADRRNQRQEFAKSCAAAVDAYRQLTQLIAAGKSAEVEKKYRRHMDNVARYLAESGIAKVRVRVLAN
jgi:GntR family transcriptional regulator, transcriptional repressor for pyruvate dehydrogenase complex